MLHRPTAGLQHWYTTTHFHTSTYSARGPSDLVAMIHLSSSHPLACDKWFETDYLGLPGDARRIGHTSFVDPAHNMLVFGGFLGQPYGDMLRLTTGDISLLLKTSLTHSLTHSLPIQETAVSIPVRRSAVLMYSVAGPRQPTPVCR